jgi:hypothetical protein
MSEGVCFAGLGGRSRGIGEIEKFFKFLLAISTNVE